MGLSTLHRSNKLNRFDLLSAEGTFLRYLRSGKSDRAGAIALHQNNLWIGFDDGEVKVFNYTY